MPDHFDLIVVGAGSGGSNAAAAAIERGLSVFDEVRIAILVNPEKSPLFSVEERVELIREAYRGEKRVNVDTFSGLLVEYARKVNASVIVRGLRAISDFEYEFQMALMNRKIDSNFDLVFLMPSEQWSYLNSSVVKEIARLGGPIDQFAPPPVVRRVAAKLAASRKTD